MIFNNWLHPNLSGSAAEKLLLEQGTCGDFLVRPSSSSPEDFTISIRRKSDVTHIKVNNNGECYSIGKGAIDGFATISELIQYFSNPDPEGPRLKERDGDVIELKRSFPCKDVIHQRWFHGNITGETAKNILLERGDTGSFLLRNSQSSPEKIVLSVRRPSDEITHIYVLYQNGEYNVGGGPKFADLGELLTFYQKYSMVAYDGSSVILKNPINITSFKGADIVQYIKHLDKGPDPGLATPVTPTVFQAEKDGIREEFECLQKLVSKDARSRREGLKPLNKSKNRYKNILPFDATRVILRPLITQESGSTTPSSTTTTTTNPTPQSPHSTGGTVKEATPSESPLPLSVEEGDYINANFIMPEPINYTGTREDSPCKGDGVVTVTAAPPSHDDLSKCYIVAQGPLPSTIGDFWRMVWQQNSRIVVMVTRELEGGRAKCAKYWPEKGVCAVYGQFRVQNIAETVIGVAKDNEEDNDVLRELYLYPKDKFEKGRMIYNFHCRTWPDHGVPSDPSSLLNFLSAIKTKRNGLVSSPASPFHHSTTNLGTHNGADDPKSIGPSIFHCSAGIGRAGSLIAIDMLINKIDSTGIESEIDVQKTVQWIRTQRSGLVQTAQQYKFIYVVLTQHIEQLLTNKS